MHLLLAIGAAVSFVVGGIFMQKSQSLSLLWPTLGIYFCFGLGATLQSWATQYGGMGITYVLVLGIEASLAVICGAILFQEGYSLSKMIGVAFITAGIILVRLDS